MSPIGAATFRDLMGRFATGVTVVTSAAGGHYHGMTANAVASVSIDPLLLLVCVDQTSYTHGLLRQSGVYAVSILGRWQEDLSRLFAEKRPPEKGTLRGVPFRIGVTGAPILEDCLAYLEGRIVRQYEGGDHTIFMGSVEDGGVANDGAPLVFFRRGYHTLSGG